MREGGVVRVVSIESSVPTFPTRVIIPHVPIVWVAPSREVVSPGWVVWVGGCVQLNMVMRHVPVVLIVPSREGMMVCAPTGVVPTRGIVPEMLIAPPTRIVGTGLDMRKWEILTMGRVVRAQYGMGRECIETIQCTEIGRSIMIQCIIMIHFHLFGPIVTISAYRMDYTTRYGYRGYVSTGGKGV